MQAIELGRYDAIFNNMTIDYRLFLKLQASVNTTVNNF